MNALFNLNSNCEYNTSFNSFEFKDIGWLSALSVSLILATSHSNIRTYIYPHTTNKTSNDLHFP